MTFLQHDKHRYRTVYYSDFWYSAYAARTLSELHGDFFRSEVEQHQYRLRLLALVFDHIYIPRTHLITSLFPDQASIGAEVVRSTDFRFLRDIGCIRVSTFPELDGSQDSERIGSRARLTKVVSYPRELDYLDDLSTDDLITIPSRDESAGNTVTFPEYGRRLAVVSKKLQRGFGDLVDRATLGDLPFFHEDFVTSARRKFPLDQFQKIWRDTNSIYLTSGAPNLRGNVVPYFNPRLESSDFRFHPAGLDRFLMGPEGIRALLTFFLKPSEVRSFLYAPIDVVASHLAPSAGHLAEIELFRNSFFDLVKVLSEDPEPGNSDDYSARTLRSRIERAFSFQMSGPQAFAGHVLTEAQAAAEMTESTKTWTGISILKQALNYGQAAVSRATRRRRYPAIVAHLHRLRNQVRSAR